MADQDISRLLDPTANRYVGSRLQQGRALLDSDFNEGAVASDREWRRATRDIVGQRASPDEGFLPDLAPGDRVNAKLVRFGAFSQAFVLDYKLRPGAMHAGGRRFEQEEAESVVFQREYLQIGPATAPRAALGTQRQLSYLRGWDQPVTAVEDGELLEPALHGADAAARIRRMCRVEVRSVDAEGCAEAFEEVLAELGDGSSATYDAATCELRSNARLELGFLGEAAGDCAGCEPALRGKYLGNEDHTIKIMLASSSSYVWAFDNGAPLYRVKLFFDGNGATVEMLTPPKDQYHEPVLQHIVELLPWSALLKNGRPTGGKAFGESVANEKLAARVGFFAEVDSPYEPGQRKFHVRIDPGSLAQIGIAAGKSDDKSLNKAKIGLKTGEPSATEVIALQWDPAHPFASELNPNDPEAEGLISYVYMRIWHVKRAGEPLTLPTASRAPLGRTGLVPSFSGTGRRGDYWRATLRTDKRDEILPRALTRSGGVQPDGPRDVIVPLALVEWHSTFGLVHEVVAVHDCRPNLPALTSRGCCTYVVGTGTSGHFRSIQAALDALPAAGGQVCVLPGTYREQIRIADRQRVTLSGCGGRTVIMSPDSPEAEALVELQSETSSSSMVLENLSLCASGQIAIACVGTGVELKELDIEARPDDQGETRSAIRALQSVRMRILGNRIRTIGGFSDHAAVYMAVLDDAVLERNTIETADAGGAASVNAWGGVQISGGSRRIELRGNEIVGGRGHGVTIGSARFRATDGSELGIAGAGLGQSSEQPPFELTGRLEPVDRQRPDGSVLRYYPDPDPAIEELLIADNEIRNCRGSGIAALVPEVVHDDVAIAAPLCIRRTTFAVERLLVRDNKIERNAQGPPGALGQDRARGGVILSEANGFSLVGNSIQWNGTHPDPGPICGVFLPYGGDIVVTGNRVANNDSLAARASVALRGGIVLTPPAQIPLTDGLTEDASIIGLVLRDNIVESNRGPALSMMVGGHCSVLSNHFESRFGGGRAARTRTSTVEVIQPGRTWEAVDLPAGEPSPARWLQPVGSQDYLGRRAQSVENSGGLVFADNQVSTIAALEDRGISTIPLLIVSTDSVVVMGNQVSAQGGRGSLAAHCWIVGSTVNVSHNRIAEGIETTRLSLVVMAPMLTLANDNIMTHCPAVFGCANHENPSYFLNQYNLNWFRLRARRCEVEANAIFPDLQALCDLLFGLGDGGVRRTVFSRRLNSIAAFWRAEQ